MTAYLCAIWLALRAIFGAGGADSLELQRAVGAGAWQHATAYSSPMLVYNAARTFNEGDSLDIWFSQSVARRTSCAYRLRTWSAGIAGPWSPVALVATGADSAFCGATVDARCVSGWAMPDSLGIARPNPPMLWRWQQDLRCWSQRDVQTFWYAAILAACGLVR